MLLTLILVVAMSIVNDQNKNLSFCKINFGGLIYGGVE